MPRVSEIACRVLSLALARQPLGRGRQMSLLTRVGGCQTNMPMLKSYLVKQVTSAGSKPSPDSGHDKLAKAITIVEALAAQLQG